MTEDNNFDNETFDNDFDYEPLLLKLKPIPTYRSLYNSENAKIRFSNRNNDVLQIGLNFSLDSENKLYWSASRSDGCYHCYNYTGKHREEFEKEDLAAILSNLVKIKLKKEVGPEEMNIYNSQLIRDLFGHLQPRKARKEIKQ